LQVDYVELLTEVTLRFERMTMHKVIIIRDGPMNIPTPRFVDLPSVSGRAMSFATTMQSVNHLKG
jgi:hypothetical protein